MAAQFGGSFWRLILAGQFGSSVWRVILASQFGMQQFILMKQQLREGCWHEASCLCCGEPEVAHARALLGSEGSRRRGINTGSSEVTEVYARSPVSLVTWTERSLGLKGVKIIV
ncbi:MAG: hypothetical protein ACK53Y_08760, partial [bacterium]